MTVHVDWSVTDARYLLDSGEHYIFWDTQPGVAIGVDKSYWIMMNF